VLCCKPIGILEVVQATKGKRERNDRIFAVPDRAPFEGDLQDIAIFRNARSKTLKGSFKRPMPSRLKTCNSRVGAVLPRRSR
jgi:hypothetical protein